MGILETCFLFSQLGDSVFMAQTAEVVIPVSQNDLQGGLEQIQTSEGAAFYQPNSAGINVLQVSMTRSFLLNFW